MSTPGVDDWIPDWLTDEIAARDAELQTFNGGLPPGGWPVLPVITSGWVLLLRWPKTARTREEHQGMLVSHSPWLGTALANLRRLLNDNPRETDGNQ